MSVLINMPMPTCCMFCPLSSSAGCRLTNPPIIMTTREMLSGRPDWCPLVAVPEDYPPELYDDPPEVFCVTFEDADDEQEYDDPPVWLYEDYSDD